MTLTSHLAHGSYFGVYRWKLGKPTKKWTKWHIIDAEARHHESHGIVMRCGVIAPRNDPSLGTGVVRDRSELGERRKTVAGSGELKSDLLFRGDPVCRGCLQLLMLEWERQEVEAVFGVFDCTPHSVAGR